MRTKSKLPNWLNRLNRFANKYMQPNSESAGEHILNKTIEKANSAKTDEERKRIYNDSAKKNLATTGASLVALSVPDWAWTVGSKTGRGVLKKAAIDMATSIAGGEVVNKVGEKLTGQPTTGRFVMSQILGDKGGQLYDNNFLVSTASDIVTNPGYAMGNWAFKGLKSAGEGVVDAVKNKIKINQTIKDAIKSGQLKFGEPTTYTGVHQSISPIEQFQFPFNQRWDVINHSADPNGVFFTLGDAAKEGFLAERPWTSTWQIASQRPLIQTGEIFGPNGTKNNMRNAIVKYGRKHGADAVEFREIADNQLQNQNILFATDKTGLRKIGQLFKGKPSTYESPNTKTISFGYENPILKDDSHLPKIWTFKDDFLNSELFKKSSDSVKNKFLEFLKPLTKQNPESLVLRVQDQPDAATIQDYLRLIVDEKNGENLPFGIIYDKDSGLFRRLPGNLQEIATQYHGIDSGLMKPLSEMATRSHNVNYEMGIGIPDDAFYAGFGDSGLVLPYTNREMKGKSFKFIDLYRSPKDVYDYYNQMANELNRIKNSLNTSIESAFKAKDYKKAAELYAKRMSMPILDQPYLIDRATRIKSGTSPLLDLEQKIANQEIRRMLRPTLEGPIDLANVKNFKFTNLMSKDGIVNFADPRFSIFTGDPSKLHGNVIGGYYVRPNIVLYEPNVGTLRSWDLSKLKDQSIVRRGLVKDGVTFPSNWKLTTDNFIKFFDSPLAIHVGDFHHTSDLATLPEELPKLLMIPKNKVENSIFRFDQFGIGLQKQGGKINRFQIGGIQNKLVTDGFDWLENWLNKRKDLLEENAIFSNTSYKNGSDLVQKQLENLNKTKYEDVPKLDSEGLYVPGTISIKTWNPDIVTHEQTHALEPEPQVDAIKQLMSNINYESPEIKEFWRLMKENPEEIPEDVRELYTKYGRDYWDDPNEIYSRRNAVLRRYGKDPTYKYTKKDLESEKMVDALMDNDLDTYEDDFLLHLFNDVASNNKQVSMTNIVRKGGKFKNPIIKAQNGWFLDTWQKAYNSKFGKGVRDILYGTDKKDLTDEEYFAKYGYSKPVGGIGVLGALVMPEWEGLEVLPVAENFGEIGIVKGIPKTAQLKPSMIKNFEGMPKATTSTIPKVGTVRSAADKHASFIKGLDTWSKRKYGIEWSKMKKEIQPGIEQEFRRIWSK